MRALLGLVCAFAIGCGDDAGDDTQSGPTWRVIADTPASLLGVTGTSANDVWIVGGRSELMGAPAVWHYDGTGWTQHDPGVRGLDLWWVFASPTSDTLYIGGAKGTILRYANGEFERMPTPPRGVNGDKGIIFGIWGVSDSDLWAVGDGEGSGSIVWRYDGTAWTELAIPEPDPTKLFKVHGQSANDVWICGDGGVTYHWQGSALERVETEIPSSLFSIVTTPEVAIAAGGVMNEGHIFEATDGEWAQVTTDNVFSPVQWRGVAAGADTVYALGMSGIVAARTDGAWAFVDQPLVLDNNFHAAWVDPDGGLWSVGGKFIQLPVTGTGFALYYGPDRVAKID